ncbi:MAG TPA: PepSY-associated TM helix domain-containing protein [Vicinamibacterales bacterium]|nr:PepSY-associated TM helix domain-containing protein [Vicinamibacterales bacterium]
MKAFRTVLFWMHLACGVAAGAVILIMCVTGVALTYEKQMLEWADRWAWTAPFPTDAAPLSPETLLARVAAAQPGTAPISITLRADRTAPATVTLDGNKGLLVNPYNGAIIGEPPARLRAFFRTMTSWHRYIAMQGDNRPAGKAITGAANLAFLFIVVSGIYLWLPRVWSRIQFRNVLWFRGGLVPKARDFDWHNVIGIWSAVPLAIVVAGAVPISYPWASNLVYRLAGDMPPAPAAAPARPAERGPVTYVATGIDGAWATAQVQIPGWRTMTTRLATSQRAPVVMTIDEGYGGQPQKRTTVSFDRASGMATRSEAFGDLSAGRRLRSWLRFAHTGEIYGLAGQTIAGLVTAGGAVLVYTGIALALRRLIAWSARSRKESMTEERPRAA